MQNKALILRARPDETFPQNMDFFDIKEIPIPQLDDGEILIRVLYIGVDPVMRVWLSGAKTYIDSVKIGQVMPAFGVGECVASKSKKCQKNDLVFGVFECANYCKRKYKTVFKVPPILSIGDPMLPLTLSIFGVTGLTALSAMNQIPEGNKPTQNKPKTFCVSSAAGSTGSIALQIAKNLGFRTVGIVSSQEKKQFLIEIGADACVTYNDAKEGDEINVKKLTNLVKEAVPEGIDVYFENAGEEILDSVLPNMAKNSYIILCGATSTYNAWKNRGGLTNLPHMIFNNVKAEGIIFINEKQIMYDAFGEMVQMVAEGTIKHQEEFMLGVDKFINGLKRVFLGQNIGKIIVQLDEQIPMPKY